MYKGIAATANGCKYLPFQRRVHACLIPHVATPTQQVFKPLADASATAQKVGQDLINGAEAFLKNIPVELDGVLETIEQVASVFQ